MPTETPLSPVFRESFLRRAPGGGEVRRFGALLARLASDMRFGTPEAAREDYRAAIRELRQAEEALHAVRVNHDACNRPFHCATVPALRELRKLLADLDAVLYRTAPAE